jgi:glycosyltransferase involved in cell wall biosynthesis
MKIALVHDQLAEFGGAERVLIAMKKAFPDAPLYTSFVDRRRLGKHFDYFKSWEIHESWIGKLPFFKKLYSPLRFLLPIIWSSFDLSMYDVVLCSSSWGMAKAVSLKNSKFHVPSSKDKEGKKPTHYPLPPTTYFCYLHTPPRYLYGYDESSLKKYWPVKVYALIVNHFLRQYDYHSSQTIDLFIFNSEEIRKRSLKFYRKDGVVLHPPITTSIASPIPYALSHTPYYLTVSRLAPTKHIDLLIKVANEKRLNLKIVGTGSEEKYLQSIAGPTVEFLGSVSDEDLVKLYTRARAFLYASLNEDFGMVPVEAMAYGVPVIALASGGVKETVIDGKTGISYSDLTTASLLEAINRFENLDQLTKDTIHKNALDFAKSCNEENFVSNLKKIVIDKD